MTRRPMAGVAVALGLLAGCGATDPGTSGRLEPPRQAPATSTSSTAPDAPTTCTGGADDPAACSEGDGDRLPSSR